jgi:signal transduction histidine kinase
VSSIRTRLVVGTVIAVIAVFAAVGLVITSMMRSSLRGEFDDMLTIHAHALAAEIDEDDGKLTSEIDLRSIDSNEVFEVWADGKVILKAPSLGTRELVATPGDRPIGELDLGEHHARQITLHANARIESETGAAAAPEKVGSPITVVFARTTTSLEATTVTIAKVMVGVGLAGVVVCVVLLLLVVHLGLRPIRELAMEISRIREHDLTARVARATRAVELAPITERLDEVLARLGAAFARERELTAEVAHELRTPLAGLRATLELALDRERPAERYRVALEQSLAITHQTSRLVESLLSLARLDAGQTSIDATPIDVDQLVRDAVATVHSRAVEREIEVVTELEPVTLTTDHGKLRVVVTNLLDNAVTYADTGGEIRVTLMGGVLRVMNTGCALTTEQAAHVFDRFWRGDASREQAAGHVGIGLALCKKLVELLDGKIDVVVRDGRFTATVMLS